MTVRLALLSVLLVPFAAHAEETRPYVVKAGDTCLGIAARELGDSAQLATLHKLNPNLGSLPHKLVPGQVIRLPAEDNRTPDANLTYQRGDVEVRRAGEDTWFRTATGADLFRAWRVGSRERASAQVTFADRSTIGMRENTVVVIFGPSRSGAQVGTMRATLENGGLRTKLAALDGKPRVVVTTQSSVTALDAGTAVVDVDKAGATRVSNHTGKPAVVTSRTRAKKSARVQAGFGTSVKVGAEPAKPQPLPAAPVWGTVPKLAIAWAGQTATFNAAWAPVANATTYRLELATDPELTAVELRFEAPGNARELELREVPPGDYYLSIVALDALGLESTPAPVQQIRVVGVPLPAGATLQANGQRALVPLGSEIAVAPELGCTLDGRTGALLADAAGHRTLVCGATKLDIEVAAVRIASSSARVAVGAQTWIEIELEGGVAPPGLELRGPTGITVGAAERTATGVRFPVIPTSASTVGEQQLDLVVASGGQTMQVGRVAVVIAPATTTASSAEVHDVVFVPFQPRAKSWLSLDAVAGMGDADRIDGERSRFGLGLTAAAYPHLNLQVGVTHSMTSAGPTLIRPGVDVPLLVGRVAPSLRAGLLMFSDGDAGAYAGVGLRVRALSRLSFVIDADGLRDSRGNFVEVVGGVRFTVN
jgi:LysM repeat protein